MPKAISSYSQGRSSSTISTARPSWTVESSWRRLRARSCCSQVGAMSTACWASSVRGRSAARAVRVGAWPSSMPVSRPSGLQAVAASRTSRAWGREAPTISTDNVGGNDGTAFFGGKTDSSPPVRGGHRLSPPSSPLDERREAASAAPMRSPLGLPNCRRTGLILIGAGRDIGPPSRKHSPKATPPSHPPKVGDRVIRIGRPRPFPGWSRPR